MNRRTFFSKGAITEGAGIPDNKDDIRSLFEHSADYIHLASLLISSHLKPVRQAIEKYPQDLDVFNAHYLINENRKRQWLPGNLRLNI